MAEYTQHEINNIFQVKQKEKEKCEKTWSSYGMIDNIEDKDYKQCVALVLENQRLFNENNDGKLDNNAFKRMSIPMVRRILTPSLHNFISIQPMLGPAGPVLYFKKNQMAAVDVYATTRNLKTIWNLEAIQDLKCAYNLAAEAECLAVLSQEIILEIQRDIFTKLRNNVGLKKAIDFNWLEGITFGDKYGKIQSAVVDLALENRDNNHKPFCNWIVTGPEMAGAICPLKNCDYAGYVGCYKYGCMSTIFGDISIYCDPLYPMGSILLGYKGEHPYDAGYIYSPYVMLSVTETMLSPDSFVPMRRFMTRCAERLVDPNYYAELKVINFMAEEYEYPKSQFYVQPTFNWSNEFEK